MQINHYHSSIREWHILCAYIHDKRMSNSLQLLLCIIITKSERSFKRYFFCIFVSPLNSYLFVKFGIFQDKNSIIAISKNKSFLLPDNMSDFLYLYTNIRGKLRKKKTRKTRRTIMVYYVRILDIFLANESFAFEDYLLCKCACVWNSVVLFFSWVLVSVSRVNKSRKTSLYECRDEMQCSSENVWQHDRNVPFFRRQKIVW